MSKIKILLSLWLLFAALTVGAQCPAGNTFTVTNNSGANVLGSIRRACQCVNTIPALTTIDFAIPGGSTMIQPAAELLISANGIFIDGGSQSGIVLDGSSVAGAPPHGLRLTGTNITVQGLEIQNFTATAGGHGIRLDANGNTVINNILHDNRNGVFTNTGVATALITENSIYCNSIEGINRATGPALPALSANTQRVKGTASANALVEVFINDNAGCAAALCQGKTFVGATTANAAGNWQLDVLPGVLLGGQEVTATSTTNGNNTSEFPSCALVADCASFDANVADTDVSCFGNTNGTATATTTGGGGGVTFLWSTGTVTANVNNLAPNTYTVTATDNAGCTTTATATIAEPALLTNSFTTQNVSCFGGSDGSITAMPGGGTPAFTYNWSNGQTQATNNNLSAGIYFVTITDMNGCSITRNTQVTQPTQLTNAFTAQNISCFGGTNGALTAVPAGGTSPFSYAWNTGQMVGSINNLIAGVYTVTVTDNEGCTVVDNTQLTQPTLITNSFTTQNINCFGGANGALTALTGGGTPGYTYVWNTGQMVASINNLIAGVYTVTVTDNTGCTIASNTQLTQPAQLTLNTNATNESTAGANNGTATATAGGGTPGFNYLWSNGGATAQISNLAPGTYTVTVTDNNGCTRSASATVNSGPVIGPCTVLPVYAVLVPSQVCGNSILSLEIDDLYPSPAVSYVWFFPNGDSATTVLPTLDVLVTSTDFSGEYFVVRDSAGCRSIPVGGAPVTVLSLDPAQVFAGADTLLCAAGVVVLKAQAPPQGTGAWVSLGAATIDTPNSAMTAARNLQTGANAFIWQVSLGNCTAAAADTVVFFLEKRALLNDDRYTLQKAQDIAVMEVLLNDALAGLADTVVTQIGAPAVGQLEYLEEGRRFRYTVDEDYRGSVQFQYAVCSPASTCNFPCDTATVTIDILNLPSVPEGLVVDDPGLNGRLIIKGISGFSRVEIAIVNRWGDLVFQEKNYRNETPWLGDFNGKTLPDGAYYFYLKAWDGNTLIGGTLTGVIHLFEQK